MKSPPPPPWVPSSSVGETRATDRILGHVVAAGDSPVRVATPAECCVRRWGYRRV